MPSRKGAPNIEGLIARFKEELVSRGYSSRTADVYATAVVSYLKTVSDPSSVTSGDADAYVAGIVESSADLIIAPDVAEFPDTAFDCAPSLIERGRQAAEKALPRIQTLLQQ